MIERAREVLAGITTVIEMWPLSRMRSVAGRCWKRWSGQLAAAVGPRFDQPQHRPHARSPSRRQPGWSYRFRPNPPTCWILPY